jgi:hypothetical protein
MSDTDRNAINMKRLVESLDAIDAMKKRNAELEAFVRKVAVAEAGSQDFEALKEQARRLIT